MLLGCVGNAFFYFVIKRLTSDLISATLFAMALVPGYFLGGWIGDKWGRKPTMFIFNLLSYIFWIASAFGNNKYLLYSNYALQGFFGSIAYNLVSK